MQSQIPEFQILYKRSNMGDKKITEWRVWIEPTEGAEGAYDVVYEYGYQDCKKVQHRKKIEKGKAKRSTLEQAILEAQSKWNEKHDREGYRTDPNATTVDNTNNISTGQMRPMLAHTYTPQDPKVKSKAYKMPFPCYLQRKLDGIRCIAHLGSTPDQIILESRKGTEIVSFDHIRSTLRELYQVEQIPRDLHFDGELYTDELPFEVISGLVRQKKDKKIMKDSAESSKIKYHVYDVYIPSQPNLNFQQRLQVLEQISTLLNDHNILGNIHVVQTEMAKTHQEVKTKHDEYVGEGFEGIMLRDPVGIYESDKRSKYLQKYKEFMEEEFPITGFHDGDGIDAGLIIWECSLPDGRKFSVKPKGTHEYRRELFENAEKYLGKNLTVIFQEYSADCVPRFPVGKSIRIDL